MLERYRGYFVDPRSYLSQDQTGWRAWFYVCQEWGTIHSDTRFEIPGRYSSREEALAVAQKMGQRHVNKLIRRLRDGGATRGVDFTRCHDPSMATAPFRTRT